jgi:hypothetical protein
VESMNPAAAAAGGRIPTVPNTTAPTKPAAITSPRAVPEGPPPMGRSSSDLQFPSAMPPPPTANGHVAAPLPQQQTPFQQLYTDHYMQQQQQQQQQQHQAQLQQQQLHKQKQQQLAKESMRVQAHGSSAGGPKAPFSDVDVNYAYWQQNKGGKGDDLTLTTFPQDLLDKGKSKSSNDGSQSRAPKGTGQKRDQKEKVKKVKATGEASARKTDAGKAAGGTVSSTGKKRKSAGGDDVNPKKALAASKAQKLARSMLSAGGHGVDMSALVPQQAGTGMAKVSGAGTVVPNDATW